MRAMPWPVLVLRTFTHSATSAPELSMMSCESARVPLLRGRTIVALSPSILSVEARSIREFFLLSSVRVRSFAMSSSWTVHRAQLVRKLAAVPGSSSPAKFAEPRLATTVRRAARAPVPGTSWLLPPSDARSGRARLAVAPSRCQTTRRALDSHRHRAHVQERPLVRGDWAGRRAGRDWHRDRSARSD